MSLGWDEAIPQNTHQFEASLVKELKYKKGALREILRDIYMYVSDNYPHGREAVEGILPPGPESEQLFNDTFGDFIESAYIPEFKCVDDYVDLMSFQDELGHGPDSWYEQHQEIIRLLRGIGWNIRTKHEQAPGYGQTLAVGVHGRRECSVCKSSYILDRCILYFGIVLECINQNWENINENAQMQL
jgi:hypothetical protein